jgi:hypothetical protein
MRSMKTVADSCFSVFEHRKGSLGAGACASESYSALHRGRWPESFRAGEREILCCSGRTEYGGGVGASIHEEVLRGAHCSGLL